MKHSLLFFFFNFSLVLTYSQQIDPSVYERKPGLVSYPEYQPIVHKEIDTLYYPYYNDVQMIRITHRYAWFDHPTFVKSDIYAYIEQVPFYLFRNRKGEILKRFNTLGREISTTNMRKPEDPRQRPVAHMWLKRNAYVGDPKNAGLWGIYPMYVKSDDDKVLVGLFDSLGNTFMEPVYESIEYIDSVFIVKKDGKFGLFDYNKKTILDIKYDEIIYKNTYRNILLTYRDGKYGLYYRNGKNLVPEEYNGIQESGWMPDCYQLARNGKFEFISMINGKIIPIQFTSLSVKRLGKYYQVVDNGYTLLDSAGNELIRCEDEIYEVINKNRFVVGKWNGGYVRRLVDKTGKQVSDIKYYYLNKLNDSVLLGTIPKHELKPGEYQPKSSFYLLNTNGGRICDYAFEGLEKINDHYFKAWRDGKLQLINERGKKMVDAEFSNVWITQSNMFCLYNGKYRFFNIHKPAEISREYDQYYNQGEGLIALQREGKVGYIDTNLNEVIPFEYEHAAPFKNGLAQVKKDGNWIVIDKQNNRVTEERFQLTQVLDNGLIMVQQKGKWGVINSSGDFVINTEYERIIPIKYKRDSVGFILGKEGKNGIISSNGHIVLPFEYEQLYDINGNNLGYEMVRQGYYLGGWKFKRTTIEYFKLNYDTTKNIYETKPNPNMGFEIVGNGNKGVRNWSGKMVIPQKYDQIQQLKHNTYMVYQKNKGCGLMDTTGKVLIPIGYQYLRDHYEHITVGKDYRSDWGLFSYDGKMIADTMFGGFERPHKGMIPFYASFNHRYSKKEGWVHDEKRVGLMDSTGKIIVEANYNEYRIPDQFKDEFLFINPYERILVNSKGELLERNGTTAEKPLSEKANEKSRRKWGLFRKRKGH